MAQSAVKPRQARAMIAAAGVPSGRFTARWTYRQANPLQAPSARPAVA